MTYRPGKSPIGGFALVLTLGLMAFPVLLVLGLTALTRIETRVATSSRLRALARQHALLGFRVALGRLQSSAGPDARLTANATILGEGSYEPGNAYWTGVWDAAQISKPPVWLVSGAEPDVSAPPVEESSVLMVGENTLGVADPARFVTVAKEPVVPSRDQRAAHYPSRGNFAYWVADEGVKASIAVTDPVPDQPDSWLSSFDATEKARMRQLVGARVGSEHLLSGESGDPLLDPDDQGSRQSLRRMLSVRQAAVLDEVREERVKEVFHDATARSRGVLADPLSGLKRDLSLAPSALGSEFERYMDYPRYMVPPGADPLFGSDASDLRRRYRMTSPGSDAEGEISFSVSPVLTDFYLLFSVHRATGESVSRGTAQNTNQIVARYSLWVELWNPYTAALLPEDLVLEVTGLPKVVLTTETGAKRRIDLQEVFANTAGAGGPLQVVLPFRETGYSGTDDRSWLPGRVYSWIGPNSYSNTDKTDDRTAKFYEASITKSIWEVPVGQNYPIPVQQRFGLATEGPINLTVRLMRSDENGGGLLARFDDFAIDSLAEPSGKNKSDGSGYKFGYRFRIIESGDVLAEDAWLKSQWLRRSDSRHPRPSLAPFDPMANYFPPKGIDPTSYTTTGVRQKDYLFDRTAGASGKNFMEDVPLFELPRQPHLSVGSLQHLHIVLWLQSQLGRVQADGAGALWQTGVSANFPGSADRCAG